MFLEGACADDPGLIPEVLSLLDADAAGHVLLDRDLAAVAREVLADGVPAALRTIRFGPYRIIDVLGGAKRNSVGAVRAFGFEERRTESAVFVFPMSDDGPLFNELFCERVRKSAIVFIASLKNLNDLGGISYRRL